VSDEWVAMTASAVQAGDRVRLPNGDEIVATRVERPFMGADSLVAFIEDTPQRWFKQPMGADAEVQVRRGAPDA
jgi:hypothetical protein